MNRTAKQFIYTLFYIGIFLLIIFLVWSIFTKKDPTCFDNVKNQNEIGVDCGGLCISCDLKNISPIEFLGKSIMSLQSGRTVMLIHVRNPNDMYHAVSYSYLVSLSDENGIERESFGGRAVLPANSDTYIYRSGITYKNPQDVDVSFSEISWKSKDLVSFPNIVLRDVGTTVTDSTVRVRGSLENTNTLTAERVHVIAILGGAYNEDVYASETILTRVPGLSKEEFVVTFPKDQEIVARLKNDKTRVIVQIEE